MGATAARAQLRHHLDAVHVGHSDICDNEIRSISLYRSQSLLAVGGFPDDHTAHGIPIDPKDDSFSDDSLVVDH